MTKKTAGRSGDKSPNVAYHPPAFGTLGGYEQECEDCGGKMKLIHGFCPWCGGQR